MILSNYDISKFDNQKLSNNLKYRLVSQMMTINPSMMVTVDEKQKAIQDTVKSVSEIVIGVKKKNSNKLW